MKIFAKNTQGISKIYLEVLKLMKFLQSSPQVKNKNMNYYDMFSSVIKKRDEKEIVADKYEKDFISLNDVNIPNNYNGIKGREY